MTQSANQVRVSYAGHTELAIDYDAAWTAAENLVKQYGRPESTEIPKFEDVEPAKLASVPPVATPRTAIVAATASPAVVVPTVPDSGPRETSDAAALLAVVRRVLSTGSAGLGLWGLDHGTRSELDRAVRYDYVVFDEGRAYTTETGRDAIKTVAAPTAAHAVPVVPPSPVPSSDRSAVVSASGKARSEADRAAAHAAGIATQETHYERGRQVNETGVRNARKSLLAWSEREPASVTLGKHVAAVESEHRIDIVTPVGAVRMTASGALAIDDQRIAVPDGSIGDIVRACRMPPGAATYLASDECWTELRASNVNRWCAGQHGTEQTMLRTREGTGGGPRELYAAVTDRYEAFDSDRVASAVQSAILGEDARAIVSYDGRSTLIDVVYHSDIQPEDYVAGEFFKAGIRIRTDDTGGGSLGGSAYVFQNLCLNLIMIDVAEGASFAFRHVGSVESLAAKFRKAFRAARASIDHFVEAWGRACHDDLRAQLATSDRALPIAQCIEGWARGILETDLVPVPVGRGKREDVVRSLRQAWQADKSSATATVGTTRAAVVNMFTRYAHETASHTPWQMDAIERAAGALLVAGAPLPFARPEA